MENELRTLIAPRQITSVLEMPGGASTRRYFRIEVTPPFDAAGGASRAVAMFVPSGDRPEEVSKEVPSADGKPRPWPFLEVRELLEKKGIRVPKLFLDASEKGWLVLEDLGDETLDAALKAHPEEKRALYRRAVSDSAKTHDVMRDLPADSLVRSRSFDYDLLLWELDHFREWGLDARGIVFEGEKRKAFDSLARRLAKRVAELPQGYVHRDYQSRNLMVSRTASESDDGFELVVIDFQDALMGPRIYDLVALLGDSYQEFDRAFIEDRIGEYAALRSLPKEELLFEFDLVTVQRKLKDAGRFVFIDQKKGNPSFLPYVEPTLRKVKASLERLADDEEMKALRRLLGSVLDV